MKLIPFKRPGEAGKTAHSFGSAGKKGNVKISTQIIIGFAIVLIMPAYIGFTGLRDLVEITGETLGVNNLVKGILTAGQEEKNFIIEKDPSHSQKVHIILSRLRGETIRLSGMKIDPERMRRVKSKLTQHETVFKSYVALENQQKSTMGIMRQKSDETMELISNIRDDQKKQLKEIRETGRSFITDKVKKVEDANRLLSLVLEAKSISVYLIGIQDETTLEKWKTLSSEILQFSREMKSRFKSQKSIDQADRIILYYEKYMQVFLRYLKSRMGSDLRSMNSLSKGAIEAVEFIRKDQNSQLAMAQEENSNKIDDKLIKTAEADRLVKWFLFARNVEKDMIIQDDRENVHEVLEVTERILWLTKDLKKRLKSEENLKKVAEAGTAVEAYTAAFKSYASLMEKQKNARALMFSASREAANACDELLKKQKIRMAQNIDSTKKGMVLVLLMAILVGVFFSWRIIRGITNPLKRVIERLSSGAKEVSDGSGELASSSMTLAEATSAQADSIRETSQSLKELTEMTVASAKNLDQADQLMKKTSKQVSDANDYLEELTQGMRDIADVDESIKDIVKTMNTVSFQTGLLALNASVEAARAGEAGTGFSVVAEEVRKLAARSAKSAEHISLLTDKTNEKLKNGKDMVKKTGRGFYRMTENIQIVEKLIGDVSLASKCQAEGIEAINMKIKDMDDITRQNAAGSEETASASEKMNFQAGTMKEIVAELMDLAGTK